MRAASRQKSSGITWPRSQNRGSLRPPPGVMTWQEQGGSAPSPPGIFAEENRLVVPHDRAKIHGPTALSRPTISRIIAPCPLPVVVFPQVRTDGVSYRPDPPTLFLSNAEVPHPGTIRLLPDPKHAPGSTRPEGEGELPRSGVTPLVPTPIGRLRRVAPVNWRAASWRRGTAAARSHAQAESRAWRARRGPTPLTGASTVALKTKPTLHARRACPFEVLEGVKFYSGISKL